MDIGAAWQSSPPTMLTRLRGKTVAPDVFWTAPVACFGSMWALSRNGQVYRYSPYSNTIDPYRMLGDGFGQCPCVIRTLSLGTGGKDVEPWLVTASPDRVTAISLFSNRTRNFEAEAESIFANAMEDPCGVDAASSEVCFMTRRNGEAYLAVANVESGEIRRSRLGSEPFAGPFRCGELTFAYSTTHLYALCETGLKAYPFPRGFQAWVRNSGQEVRPSFGRLPFLVCGRSVYIPGSSVAGPAFLLQRLRGGVGETAMIPIAEEATYAQGFDGRPAFAMQGRISVLEEANLHDVRQDTQITSRRPAFVSDKLCAAGVETAGGEKLRLFTSGDAIDIPIGQLPEFMDGIGFYGVGASLVYAYVTDKEHLGLVSWYD